MFDRVIDGLRRLAVAIVSVGLLAACVPKPLIVPGAAVAIPNASTADSSTQILEEGLSSGSSEPPADTAKSQRKIQLISDPPPAVQLPPRADPSANLSDRNSLTVGVEGMPTRNFLNYVFGELLKVNYLIVEGTPGLDDPVTFNAQKAVTSRQLFRLIVEFLATRNISIVEKERMFFIGPANAKNQQGLPIGYGRNPSDVPEVPGKIFQIIPLRYGPNSALTSGIQRFTAVEEFYPESAWDAYVVVGSRTEILRVLDLIKLFDRPSAKGSRIGLVTLTYIGSDEFIRQVTTLLSNEGIAMGNQSLLSLVSLERLGGVVAFSSSDAVLDRLEFWAKQLDRPGEGTNERYFVYQPRFARAADLGESIASLLSGGATAVGNFARDTRSALGASGSVTSGGVATAETALRRESEIGRESASNNPPTSVVGSGITLSIDNRSNSLIFFTTGSRYEALLPMIRRLDVPPKQVVLEAMIAEVSLSGEFSNGVEFAFREGKLLGGTSGGLGLPSGGLALTYDLGVGEQIRMRLQASDARVNVLSSPILVVKDGVAATIQVGNDVPTVGATASDPIQSDRVLTTVLYRKTGLTLSITPSVNSEGSVLLTISQSTTTTVPGSSGVAGAPIFFQRSVNTEVVAGSGQTVFLAGLRSESDSSTNSRVPLLGALPLIGKAFSSDTRRREKTELVVLITPRVIENTSQWQEVMNGLRGSMQLLSIPDNK